MKNYVYLFLFIVLIASGLYFFKTKEYKDSLAKSYVKKAKYNEFISNNYVNSIKLYNQAILQNYEDSKLLLRRGVAKILNKNYQNALVDFEELIKLEPKNYLAYYNKAIIYLSLFEYDKALSALDDCIRMNKSYVKAYLAKTYVYSILNQEKEIIDNYVKAMEYKQKLAKAYYERQNLDWLSHDFLEIIKFCQNNKRNDFNLYYDQALAHISLNQYQDALENLLYYKNHNEANIQIIIKIKDVYIKLSDYDNALKFINLILDINSLEPKSLSDKADILYIQNKANVDQVEKLYKKALKINPNFDQAYIGLGDLFFSKSDYRNALIYYKKINDNKNYLKFKKIALSEIKLFRFKNALKNINTSLDLNPLDSQLYKAKGFVKNRLVDYQGAIDAFNVAYKLSKNDPEILKFRGAVKLKINNKISGLQDLELAKKLYMKKSDKTNFDFINNIINKYR